MIVFRRLALADLGEVERIERDACPIPWSRSMFAGELAKPTSICVGAVDLLAERLIGYLVVSRYVDAWHVMNLVVCSSYRRRGIAAQLLTELFKLTADDLKRGFALETRASNKAAIALYGRLGFRATGVRRGYYTDNREDALVMWKDAAAVEVPSFDGRRVALRPQLGSHAL